MSALQALEYFCRGRLVGAVLQNVERRAVSGRSAKSMARQNNLMSTAPIQFEKIWIDQCRAAEGILGQFGLQNALDYLIGEKLFNFVQASEQRTEFAAELPLFVVEIRRLFAAEQIRDYLDHLEQNKYLAPREPDLEFDDLEIEDADLDDAWLENPLMGAEELLRFCHVRQLLQ